MKKQTLKSFQTKIVFNPIQIKGGFLDEKNPPKWECEDKCLDKKDDKLCGTTDHF